MRQTSDLPSRAVGLHDDVYHGQLRLFCSVKPLNAFNCLISLVPLSWPADIRCARKDRNRTSQIAEHAEDGVEFLRNRQEFWRQQKLSTGPGGVSVSARRKTPTPTGTAGSAGSGGSARATPATPQAVS